MNHSVLKRIRRPKPGDIYRVILDNGTVRFFQCVAQEPEYMGSDVIRVFKRGYPIDYNPSMEMIVNDDIEIYTHTWIKTGVNWNLWDYCGHWGDYGTTELWFKTPGPDWPDPDKVLEEINKRHLERLKDKLFYKWQIWKINGPRSFFNYLPEEHKDTPYGGVLDPRFVIDGLSNQFKNYDMYKTNTQTH